jgi:hypothetical protein
MKVFPVPDRLIPARPNLPDEGFPGCQAGSFPTDCNLSDTRFTNTFRRARRSATIRRWV